MMRLYREEGVNPATGCITGLFQAPFLFILYSVIRGLSNTIQATNGKLAATCQATIPPVPPHYAGLVRARRTSRTPRRCITDIVHATPPGAMLVWHMNIALKAISSHGSIAAAIPFYALIAIAVGRAVLPDEPLNSRNPNKSQMSSQMQMFQRFTPILFAYIYFIVPAAAVIYMVFSSLIRILTQDLIFRYDKGKPAVERKIPAAVADAAPTNGAKGDANDNGKVTPTSQGSSKNGTAAKADAPKPTPQHPRSRDKKKRKAR